MTKPGYFIISCDGGGIRGLITAMLLEDLDVKCSGFLKKVDLFAGTSTGGIIALGLAAGIPTSKIRQLYENDGGQIFVPFQPGLLELFGYVKEYVDELLAPSPMAHAEAAAMSAEGFGGLASTLRTIEDVFHVKYTADGLAGLLRKTFHARMMSEIQPVLVATYNIAPANAPSYTRVFADAGSASLQAELSKLSPNNAPLRPGDVLIQGGYPGHAVIVLDVAEGAGGKQWILLGQSYMPAQQFHVLKNPRNEALSPWYDTADLAGGLQTPEWRPFSRGDVRRFPAGGE